METQDGPSQDRVKLVASTGDITTGYSTSSKATDGDTETARSQDGTVSYFEKVQWTADGTTLLASSSTNLVSGYIVPEHLLTASSELTLEPQAAVQLPETSIVLSGAPYFSLAQPWTQQLLVSARDHPIQLFCLTPSLSSPSSPASTHSPISSYPFTKARSETFLTATSLIWPSPGTHFIAGSRSLLARFDIQRTGEEPLTRIRTIPSERHLSKGGGVGMRGDISALGGQPMDAGLVAAGTWTRWVGLYDFTQAGTCVATWGIAAALRETAMNNEWSQEPRGIGGDGITQTIWSPCGRYLIICERKSRGALIYDVRVTGKLLGYLTERDAVGNQRVACDVFPSVNENSGFEVWSGTSNGIVKVWEGVGSLEGPHAPAWEWVAHRSTISNACLHPSGTVVATCAGSWEFPDGDDELPDDSPSNSDQSHSNNSERGSDVSRSDFEPHSTASQMPWMHRRIKESSLKLWSVGDAPTIAQGAEHK
ncbi:hypothetical protein F5B22DRAFT_222464 [Xylaria bambusicola]|uniref:uncharacterized protein n=1 Tax=Xylaria bambusicola TaxID=326684 RepID=UPI002007FDC5|nr:uncharacterized protein F5B22DRAFT_222464 [Xylaria bambusicola]KAI0514850.1 hypothetical protein F5B22DRAFT_222464 [Xylaria bambusicola]